ncbi:hypothetical protein EDC04DRAFT_2893393 [Pisolithus marmoratus]|nr:hypothetical protein EDC04DRAFT_2893393 [Pisolithus marmoratus]
MPSVAISAALLLLGNSEGLPWTSSTWQHLTMVIGIPWHTDPDAAPNTPVPNVSSWSTAIAESVKTYAQNLWAQPNIVAQAAYARRSYTDNDAQGCTAWNGWVSANWSAAWKLNRIIDEVLAEVRCSPYDTLAWFKVKKVHPDILIIITSPLDASIQLLTLEDSQALTLAPNALAFKLFGDNAYPDGDPTFLIPAVKSFIDHLLVNTWHRYCKALGREAKDIAKKEASLDIQWQALMANRADPSIRDIKSYLVHICSLMMILHHYQDADTLSNLEEKKKPLLCVGSALTFVTELPKALREALKKLVKEHEIREVEQLVQAALENIQPDNGMLELPDGNSIDFSWKEGVEDLSHLTEDELWAHLSLKEAKAIPLFQMYTDPDAAIEPWTDEGESWLKNPDSGCEPLHARWHQLVGILRMLQRAFRAEPVLLMDGVGIGKTFQVIGFIACLAWFRSHFATHKKFPGSFINLKWQGKDGNIPDLPFLIRRDWWTQVKAKSQQQPHWQIILATDTAIQDDGMSVFLDLLHHVEDEPKPTLVYHHLSPRTVFGHEFLRLIIDEAHKARKFNKFHQAVHALCKQSATMIAMSATPVMTHLQDLWIVGSVMGIPTLKNKAKFDKMSCEASGLLAGEESSALDKSTAMRPVLQQWVPFLCEVFSKHVIQRTLDSLNHHGKKIFGLPPYQEHVMLLELHEWEMAWLAKITDELVHSPSLNTIAGAGKNFYIEFHHGLLHLHMNPSAGNDMWTTPSSLQEWKGEKCSTKLDILAQIVAHHLTADNARPLKVNDDGMTLRPYESQPATSIATKEPDCVIIFSAFPSSNAAIIDVLKLHGIASLELHGKISPIKCKLVLNEFWSSTCNTGARVLILSLVGMVGLNLACANVMIIADTLWSALEDEQLRGQIYRYPQQKEVLFYRLVAHGTPDVFLNNIAFDKGNLHKAFVGMDEQSRALFTGNAENTGVTDTDSEADDIYKGEPAPMEVDEPLLRNKEGLKKICNKTLKQPVTPPQPATKWADPFSPPSAGCAQKPLKKTKSNTGMNKSKHHQPTTTIIPSPTLIPAMPAHTPMSDPFHPASSTCTAPHTIPTAAQDDITHPAATQPVWNPDDDTIFQQMMDDPDWQRDPNELDALAALTLKGSSSNNATDVANTANTANATDAADTADVANTTNVANAANAADTVIQDPLLSSPPLSPCFIPHATRLACGVSNRKLSAAGLHRIGSTQPAAEQVAGALLILRGEGTFRWGISRGRNHTYGGARK